MCSNLYSSALSRFPSELAFLWSHECFSHLLEYVLNTRALWGGLCPVLTLGGCVGMLVGPAPHPSPLTPSVCLPTVSSNAPSPAPGRHNSSSRGPPGPPSPPGTLLLFTGEAWHWLKSPGSWPAPRKHEPSPPFLGTYLCVTHIHAGVGGGGTWPLLSWLPRAQHDTTLAGSSEECHS